MSFHQGDSWRGLALRADLAGPLQRRGDGRERVASHGSLCCSKMKNWAWETEKAQNSSGLQFLGAVSEALSVCDAGRGFQFLSAWFPVLQWVRSTMDGADDNQICEMILGLEMGHVHLLNSFQDAKEPSSQQERGNARIDGKK